MGSFKHEAEIGRDQQRAFVLNQLSLIMKFQPLFKKLKGFVSCALSWFIVKKFPTPAGNANMNHK